MPSTIHIERSKMGLYNIDIPFVFLENLFDLPPSAKVVAVAESPNRLGCVVVRIHSEKEPIAISVTDVKHLEAVGDAFRGIGTPTPEKGPLAGSFTDEAFVEDDENSPRYRRS